MDAGAEPVRGPVNGTVGGPMGAPAGQRRPVRVAAVDCGTNSLRLLIADVDPLRGELTDVDRRMEIVRLGQGVDATGRLGDGALARTFGVLSDYAAIIEAARVQAVRMVATSATRDAANATVFVHGVNEILGVRPEVLSGDQEARLAFTGATAELAPRSGYAEPAYPPPYLVTDIGGGSTEFVIGADGLAAGHLSAISVDIGCVRLTERHLHSDPPRAGQIAAATADINAALSVVAGKIPVSSARTLVGLAGSVTTIAAIALGMHSYDAARIHHARIPAEEVSAVTACLLRRSRAERAAISVLHPGRADVIGAGALVLDRVLSSFGFTDVVASEHDVLDGIAWSIASGGLPR
jgi:exopolyphosphatase / guanosine-5'-triphosphate,3'-diphosphate pyrophosphatase